MNQISRYQILHELGGGGMALVYRAHDPQFKRDVAIKVIASHFLHNPQFRQRFSNEAQVIATLQHPAIVPVYDFGEENGRPYLVMALMEGGSLTERLQQGRLSLQQTIQLLAALAPALDLAHQKGIVHRDLKPDNILFDAQDNPYIADFGIAKLLLQSSMGLSQSGIGIGTPFYMSPEQAQGDRNIDGRSDIYSLAIMAFYMLTGQLPYEADNPLGVAFKHISDPIPDIRLIRPDLPPGTEHVMARAMAKNADERYGTVTEMVAALDAVANGTYQTASVPATTGTLSYDGHFVTGQQTIAEKKATAPSVSPPTRLISVIVGTVLALILLIGIGFMMNSSPSEQPSVVSPSTISMGNSTTPSNITVTPDVPKEDEPDLSITTTTEAEQPIINQTATAEALATFEAQQTVTSEDVIATQTAEAAQTANAAAEQTAVAATQATQAAQAAAGEQTVVAATQIAEAQQTAVAAAQTAEAQQIAEAQQTAVAAAQTAEAQQIAEAQQTAVAAAQTAEAQQTIVAAAQTAEAIRATELAWQATQTAEAQRIATARAYEATQAAIVAVTLTAEANARAFSATKTAVAAATLTAQARAITVYRVNNTSFVCGPRPANDSNDNGRVGIRLIPDNQTSRIQIELAKCNFEPFGKSGDAYIYVNGAKLSGPLRYSSGVVYNYFEIYPLNYGLRGTNRYEVYIYPDDEARDSQNPPHISGAIEAWDEVIYP